MIGEVEKPVAMTPVLVVPEGEAAVNEGEIAAVGVVVATETIAEIVAVAAAVGPSGGREKTIRQPQGNSSNQRSRNRSRDPRERPWESWERPASSCSEPSS
jgi:hypothetical protein